MNINHFYPEMHTGLTKRPALKASWRKTDLVSSTRPVGTRRMLEKLKDYVVKQLTLKYK